MHGPSKEQVNIHMIDPVRSNCLSLGRDSKVNQFLLSFKVKVVIRLDERSLPLTKKRKRKKNGIRIETRVWHQISDALICAAVLCSL